MVKKPVPPPRKGGSQNHKCDDQGETYVENNRLYTCCSICGGIVAIDPYEDTE